MDQDTTTNPPRRRNWKFAWFALLWALVIVPAGSFLYALAVYYLEWISAAILVLFVFAFLNGCGVTALAAKSGCRSKSAMYAAALLFGLWSIYLGWVSWVWMLNDYWSLGLIFDPRRLGRVLGFVADDNYRQIGNRNVPVWEWFAYWGIEAAVPLLVPAAVVRNAFLKKKKPPVIPGGEGADSESSESLPSRR